MRVGPGGSRNDMKRGGLRRAPAACAVGVIRLVRAFGLNARERSLGEPCGHMRAVEGPSNAPFKLVGHDRASLSRFFPREIHEYTVPTGMPVIWEISRAV